MQNLIDHFGELARPRRSHQPAGLGVGKDDPFGPHVIVRRAAAHDAECACLGAGLAAGYWGIDEAKSLCFRNRVEFARDDRRGGCVIDENRRFFEALEGALRAGRHGAQIVVVSDAGKDKLLALRGLAGGRRAAAAKFFDPFLRPRRRAIVNRDVMAVRLEVPGHGVAHDAEAEERDFCHGLLSARIPIQRIAANRS